MLGKQHLAIHIVILWIFVIILLSIPSFETPLNNFFNSGENYLWIGLFISLFLYILSAILPDSDSNDLGSKIFYSPIFYIFGLIHRLLELPIRKIAKRDKGHRQSLHSIFGAFISSVFWAFLIFGIFSAFNIHFKIVWIFYWFLTLFFGQILHFIEDRHWEWI